MSIENQVATPDHPPALNPPALSTKYLEVQSNGDIGNVSAKSNQKCQFTTPSGSSYKSVLITGPNSYSHCWDIGETYRAPTVTSQTEFKLVSQTTTCGGLDQCRDPSPSNGTLTVSP